MDARPATPEELLAHADWVRALARSLVRDPEAADELVQETWLGALSSPPRAGATVRAWLARVTRNALRKEARGGGRRRAREEAAARPEAQGGAAEAVERLAAQQDVVRAVLALAEPQRSAIVLRYYEGRTAAEIAALERAEGRAVGEDAIRQRLHRARESLRAELAGRWGGERGAWSPALLALAGLGRESGGALATGGTWVLAGSGAGKLALAAAALAVLGLVALRAGRPGGGSPSGGPGAPVADARESRAAADTSGASPVEAVADAGTSSRALLPAAETGPAAETTVADGSPASLVVAVRSESGAPLADRVVLVRATAVDAARSEGAELRTGADGTARLDGLSAGMAEVRLLPGALERVELVAGDTRRIELVLREGIVAVGRVVDPEGAPVAGAEVWIDEPGDAARSHRVTRADERGRFRLPGLTLAEDLGARAPGYAPSAVQSVRGETGTEWPVELVLERAGIDVVGRVVDPRGAGVPDALVLFGSGRRETVWLRDSREGRSPPPVTARTDADGSFAAHGVPVGRQEVRAQAEGFGTTLVDVVLAAGGEELVLALTPAARVEGRVVDAAGNPVAGARVSVERGPLDRSTALSGADGRYALAGLAAGEAGVWARHPDAGRARGSVELVPGASARWDARLAPTPTLRGVLVDARGAPVAGWDVALLDPDEDEEVGGTTTDPAGAFAFDGLGEDLRYDLRCDPPGRWMELPHALLTGIGPGPEPLVVRLRDRSAETGSIAGRVLDPDGRPVAGTMVTGWHDEAPHSWFGIVPRGDGSFEIERLPPGPVFVSVRSSAWPWRNVGRVEVEAGRRTEVGDVVLDRPAIVSGELRGLPEGYDPAALEGRVLDEEWEPSGRLEFHGGRYRTSPLAPGIHHLRIEGDLLETRRFEVELTAGEDLRRDVELAPAGVRRVLLRSERDLSEAWVICQVVDAEDALRWRWAGEVPAEGRELRVSVAPGSYRLEVHAEDEEHVDLAVGLTVTALAEEPDVQVVTIP